MAIEAARPHTLGRGELTLLLAASMSLAAMGIDIMLPALGDIRTSFGLAPDSTSAAGIITAYFLGLAVAQVGYGPLADRFGRKPVLYVGYAIYIAGAIAAAVAPSLAAMYLARFVWGVGAAGPRAIALAIVRDTFEGERMARAMSFIMAVFILVPVLAPALGAGLLSIVTWPWLMAACALWAVGIALWARRLPETLHPEHRLELELDRVWRAARTVATNRQTRGYTLALTALYGVLTSYIASSEIIVGDVFGLGDAFPLVFGGLAVVMGAAMLANGFIVERVGTKRLAGRVLVGYVAAAALLTLVALATGGTPPFWLFAVGMAALLACHALLIPNFNAIAMLPMGAIAGTASAVIGAFSTAVGAILGSFLDRAFDGTVLPITIGFLVYGLLAGAAVLWAERADSVAAL